MPQQMGRAAARARHARTTQRPRHDRGDGTRRIEGTQRSSTADEHCLDGDPRSAVLQVADDGLPDFLAQWQSRLTATLPRDVNPGPLPVDVTQPKMRDVAGPKPQTGQQQQNGAIPPTDGGCRIARRNDAFHIVWLEGSWQRRQTPVCHPRDGSVQADRAVAVRDQKPHDHPERRGAGLDGRRGTTMALFQDKGSQAVRVPLARLLSELLQQRANVAAMVQEGGIARPALQAHPLAECRQENRIGNNRRRERERGAESGVSQVLQKRVRTLCQALSVRVTLMWASASAEVAAELCERLLVHLLNWQAVPIGPVDEVLRRSQIPARGNRGVAHFRQDARKPVEQGSRRTITKCTKSSPAWVEVR